MLVTERRWVDLAELFALYLAAGQARPGTILLRLHYLGHLAGAYRLRLPEALDTDDLAQALAMPRWKPETRKSARASWRAFYRWLHLTGRVPSDPSLALPTVRVPRAQPRPVPVAVFTDAVRDADDRTRLILTLGRFAGLRREEIATVHTRDVDERGWLRVDGKGGHVRRVPLHPVLVEQLHRLPHGWAFPGPDGHLTPGHVGRLASRALPDGWTLHTCRHRAGTDLYAVRRDLRAVQEILGHASVATTQRYVQVDDDALVAAVLSIPA